MRKAKVKACEVIPEVRARSTNRDLASYLHDGVVRDSFSLNAGRGLPASKCRVTRQLAMQAEHASSAPTHPPTRANRRHATVKRDEM